MGFNKRHFNEKSIKESARTYDFNFFKKWLIGPDACFFSDTESNKIWTEFLNGNEETRQTIYKKLRNEAE
jgi:hypothetical protein